MHATQPSFFKHGPKPLTRLALFSLLSLALMIGDVHYRVLGVIRQQVSVILYPVQWLASTPFTLTRFAGVFLTQQTELLAENRKLNDERLSAAMQGMRLKQLETENANLRGLMEAQRSLPRPSQLAEILYYGRDPFSAKLIINRGGREGIKEGRIVADATGLVGQIIRVQPLTSEVRLISDRNHMVPVVVERNQIRTIVYGMGKHQPLEVRNMASNVDIQQGDTLFTSGIDGVYPAGLPVARVTKVDRQSVFARIQCAPIAAIDQHRFVLSLEDVATLPAYPVDASVPESSTGKKKRKGL